MDKYSRQAAHYDRRWNRPVGDVTLQVTLEAIPWEGLNRVLDVGCGTGLLEEAINSQRKPSRSVVGLDISLAMLRQAHGKLNGAPGVRWINAQAENLPFVNASFDAVVCTNSFHYYRHPLKVLQEFHRVVRPTGRLVLVDWCNNFLACKVSQWALQFVHRTGIHRYALERCYTMAECEDLLCRAGFHVELGRRVRIHWGWGVMVFRARPDLHPSKNKSLGRFHLFHD
ncbi:MAG: methyltransferase domain-containing protein [Acidobacteria bacterium]|nr:methyltransferase domain-containing protein [Acidobacteriota bacterium]